MTTALPNLLQTKTYLFTHVHFEISWNDDRVIEINVSTDPSQVCATQQRLMCDAIAVDSFRYTAFPLL